MAVDNAFDRFFLTALTLAVFCASPAAGVEQYRAGGNSGLDWGEVGALTGLIEQEGALSPAVVNPTRNALRDLGRLGGSINSPQASREDLTLLLTDGNDDTTWRVTRERRPDGTSMQIDLGAILPISRLRFTGIDDSFLRAYELFVHDGDPDQLRNGIPVAFVNQVASNLDQNEPVIDVTIPLQFVRFIRLISRSTQEFTFTEAEVFGDGFAPTGDFVSEIIDLGVAANIGSIELAANAAELTDVVLQTRTGSVSDPRVYFRKTEVFQGVERAQVVIVPVGSPEAADEYQSLKSDDRGEVVDNIQEWSPWSSPYENLTGSFLSPGNRRYVQFRLLFSSRDVRQGAVVESFSFDFSVPTLARELVGEVWPADVELGQVSSFDYFISSGFSATNPGFDQIEIRTPFLAELREVELNGVPAAFEEVDDGDESKLTMRLTENRVESTGDIVRIGFDALVTVYGTTFFGRVFDTTSQELGQDVIAGDATPQIFSDRLSIQGELREGLILNLGTSTPVLTPNGDGVNDEIEVSYILLRALAGVPVDMSVYELSGRRIRSLQDGVEINGPQAVFWNGQDDAGELVPPGIYILRVEVETDTKSETSARVVGVAY